LWPFLRLPGMILAANALLARDGIGRYELARPETRLRRRLVMDLFDAWTASSGDAALGLQAGFRVERGDFETMEYAARSCADLREAIECIARYVHLVNEAAEVSLVEYGDHALVRFGVNDGVRPPRAANDFAIACAATFARQYAQVEHTAVEVHLMHDAPADTAPYDVFRAKLRFGMPHNGFVIPRSTLDRPMLPAHPAMQEVFEMYAREQTEKLTGARGRAREIIVAQLPTRDMSMESVAAEMGVSVATLRRRLEEERTTFTGLVDEIRRDLAEQHLRDPRRTIGEVALLLGFAHAPAFHKAFRRWTGVTPAERRARM
jgi:AraC-like DNA-binding protein